MRLHRIAERARAVTFRLSVPLATAVVVTIAGFGLGVLAPSTAFADSSGGVAFVNAQRSANGLAALRESADLDAVAASWSAHMAAAGVLSHTPNLGGAVCCWVALGQNVGEGPSVSSVDSAFMASPEHRANILGASYTQIGIGVAKGAGGDIWITQIFRRPSGAAAPAPAPTAVVHAPPVAPKAPVVRSHPTATHTSPADVSARTAQAVAQLPVSRGVQRTALTDAKQFAGNLEAMAGVGTGSVVTGLPALDPVASVLQFTLVAGTVTN